LSGLLSKSGRDEVLDLINQTFAIFGDALPTAPAILALRARSKSCTLSSMHVESVQGPFTQKMARSRFSVQQSPLSVPHSWIGPRFSLVVAEKSA
jgi:hypothetical protein